MARSLSRGGLARKQDERQELYETNGHFFFLLIKAEISADNPVKWLSCGFGPCRKSFVLKISWNEGSALVPHLKCWEPTHWWPAIHCFGNNDRIPHIRFCVLSTLTERAVDPKRALQPRRGCPIPAGFVASRGQAIPPKAVCLQLTV